MNKDLEDTPKLFVGALPWSVSSEDLRDYFGRFGEVTESIVMKNLQTGNSRGFGFVTFKSPSSVKVVLSSGPHTLDGKIVDPKPDNAKNASVLKDAPKIFVGGVPIHSNKDDLEKFFSNYGTVLDVHVVMDHEKGRHRGFGFVTFESKEVVDQLLAMQFVSIEGRQVEIKRAQASWERQQEPAVKPNTYNQASWSNQQPNIPSQQQSWGYSMGGQGQWGMMPQWGDNNQAPSMQGQPQPNADGWNYGYNNGFPAGTSSTGTWEPSGPGGNDYMPVGRPDNGPHSGPMPGHMIPGSHIPPQGHMPPQGPMSAQGHIPSKGHMPSQGHMPLQGHISSQGHMSHGGSMSSMHDQHGPLSSSYRNSANNFHPYRR